MTCQHPTECKEGDRCLWCESLEQAKLETVGMNVKELFDGLAKVSNAYLSQRMCVIEEKQQNTADRLERIAHRAAERFGELEERIVKLENHENNNKAV